MNLYKTHFYKNEKRKHNTIVFAVYVLAENADDAKEKTKKNISDEITIVANQLLGTQFMQPMPHDPTITRLLT